MKFRPLLPLLAFILALPLSAHADDDTPAPFASAVQALNAALQKYTVKEKTSEQGTNKVLTKTSQEATITGTTVKIISLRSTSTTGPDGAVTYETREFTEDSFPIEKFSRDLINVGPPIKEDGATVKRVKVSSRGDDKAVRHRTFTHTQFTGQTPVDIDGTVQQGTFTLTFPAEYWVNDVVERLRDVLALSGQ